LKVLKLVCNKSEEIFNYALNEYKRKYPGKDDILDAISIAVTARESIDDLISIPEKRDSDIKIITIDEIGKMELFHPAFLKIIERITDSDKIVLATISYKIKRLISKFGNRSDTLIFNLENAPKDTRKRKELKEKILKVS
jgi:nucleoside-triphosphatase THEP1